MNGCMMRFIKFFVIFGAVVIMMGLGALFFKLNNSRSATIATSGMDAALVEENLFLPPGARVSQLVSMDASGVATLVELPKGGGQLLFFSSQGKLKRRISLTPTPLAAPHSPDN